MNTSGDAAEQVARISFEGLEFSIKTAGAGAKEAIAMIYAMLKDHEENSIGKTKLKNILKYGKDLKVFGIQQRYLEKFEKEAKKYGVTFCPLVDKSILKPTTIVDVLVKGDDAARVNRIVEKFKLQLDNKKEEKEEKEGASQNFLEKESQSESSLKVKEDLEGKPSVKEMLNEIKKEIAIGQVGGEAKEKSFERG